jgi:predicted 3-demethylubiquinone-9 3-methyltransferase (glyoxalase superfamily)
MVGKSAATLKSSGHEFTGSEIRGDERMQGISPFLWFNDQAEEAANLYTSVFKNSKIKTVNRYSDAGPGPKGSVMIVAFELDGREFVALNGGPHFKFTEAISFVVNCENQQEVDHYWEKLSEGGQKSQCGWLKDKYGLSWQIVPTALGRLVSNPDPEKSKRVMQAMMKMTKIDIGELERAAKG